MASRRAKKATYVPPPPREIPAEALPWFDKDIYSAWSIQHSSTSLHAFISDIRAGVFQIPRFQRPFVWNKCDILRLLESMYEGYATGSLILWERPPGPTVSEIAGLSFKVENAHERTMVVVDGQQRIGALALAVSGAYGFDFRSRLFVVDQPEDEHVISLRTFFSPDIMHRYDWARDVEVGAYKLQHLSRRLDYYQVSSVRLPLGWTGDRVVESYRRLATAGVPMSHNHVEEGVRRWIAENEQKGA